VVVGEQSRLSADLADLGRVKSPLDWLCHRCQAEANADGVGLAVISSDGVPEPTFVSDSRSRLIEDLQFTLGEGPCVDAVRSGSPVLLDDVREITDATRRWPAFAKEAESSGIRAVFAFPVRVGAIALGILDLYRSQPGTLDAEELAAVLRTVDRIASVLLDVSAAGGDGVTEPTYRLVVHQAAGMVMAQSDSNIASALARLRATAFSEEIPINDLAADIVAGRRRFSKEEQ
jgi:GAF domain-containing protein